MLAGTMGSSVEDAPCSLKHLLLPGSLTPCFFLVLAMTRRLEQVKEPESLSIVR